MEEKKDNYNQVQTKAGTVHIADEVVSTIVGLAAIEVDGITSMSGGMAGGIAEKLGHKNLSRGIKVEVGEKEAAVDLYIIVDFGISIPEVASKAQQEVKKAVEKMTGLSVVEVNVYVQGITLTKEEEAKVK